MNSVFYGGGTPSLLTTDAISRIHEALTKEFSIDWNDVEVTIEANPQDITPQYAKALQEMRINRVSLGVQSLSPAILSFLGREHSPQDVRTALSSLHSASLENINMDIIFGSPVHSLSELKRDLESYIALYPAHISTYSLTIEPGTPFYKAATSGALTPMSDELVREQYETLMELLPTFGFFQYEVSNFARPGFQCRHNEHYWMRESYLGLGPGAHSYLKEEGTRWANVRRPEEYRSQLMRQELPIAWAEQLSREDVISEILMLGLRRVEGIELVEPFSMLTPLEAQRLSTRLQALHEEGLGVHSREKGRFSLTKDGLCVADSIISDLIASIGEAIETTEKK